MAEYIEREDIEYPYMSMSMWGINSATCKAYNEGVKAVEDAISAMPTADVVEVRHGYWKDNRNGTFTCSVCGGNSSKMDWCGRCGAKMDGKGDNK